MTEPAPALAGKTVLVLRATGQEASLLEALSAQGAEVLHVPMIEILPPASFDALDAALRRLNSYQWIVFTSANGVSNFCRRAAELGIPLDALHGEGMSGGTVAKRGDAVQVCAIGPATAAELKAHGLAVHRIPDAHIAEGIVEAFAGEDLRNQRVLLPRAAAGRDLAPDALRAQGATVDVVETYRSALPAASVAAVEALAAEGRRVDWVVFSSGSTVKNFLSAGGRPLLASARTVSIGPATSAVMRKHALEPTAECAHPGTDALVQAILGAEDGSVLRASMKD